MKLRDLYLDTTYVMPFLYLDIDVKGFSRTLYKGVIKSVDNVHISEISIIEAKAKSLKISENLPKVNEKFNEGLSVLSTDEKVIIHGYRPSDDKKFNEFTSLGLGFFDRVILAQSFTAGNLLTEDSKLLNLENIGIKIMNWSNLIKEMGLEKKSES